MQIMLWFAEYIGIKFKYYLKSLIHVLCDVCCTSILIACISCGWVACYVDSFTPL